MARQGYVYILTNKPHGTLYTGITTDIARRVWEHKNGLIEGFTKEHQLHRLVHVEQYDLIADAIAREKNIKAWKRSWKIQLIKENNPRWEDLYNQL